MAPLPKKTKHVAVLAQSSQPRVLPTYSVFWRVLYQLLPRIHSPPTGSHTSPMDPIPNASSPHTYLPTPRCRVLLEKLTGLQLVKKFPAFHGTRRFITALTSLRHLSLSLASPIQSIYPHPTSWRSILILSTHLRLGRLFPLRFPHQYPIHSSLLTHTRHMPSPAHSSPFYHPHNIGWGVQIIQLLVMQSPPFPRNLDTDVLSNKFCN